MIACGMFEIIRRTRNFLTVRARPTYCPARQPQMAPKLPASTHARIRCMIENGSFTNRQIATMKGVKCSINAVKAIKRNLRDFGSTTRPGRGGRPTLTDHPLNARCSFAHLDEHPELYLEEMVEWLWDEFGVAVTKSTVSRTLHSAGRLKKKFRRKAAEQNPDLVDYYLHSISSFHSY
ncbi:Homeodomain-containing protein [Cladophialophora immunda]|nr:Homeodomain-containing protein [Cladophialophora immunda]